MLTVEEGRMAVANILKCQEVDGFTKHLAEMSGRGTDCAEEEIILKT